MNVGDVAYKAAKDVGSTDAFSGVGFTVERNSVDSNTDSFLVRSVSFAGVALDKSEVTIAKASPIQLLFPTIRQALPCRQVLPSFGITATLTEMYSTSLLMAQP